MISFLPLAHILSCHSLSPREKMVIAILKPNSLKLRIWKEKILFCYLHWEISKEVYPWTALKWPDVSDFKELRGICQKNPFQIPKKGTGKTKSIVYQVLYNNHDIYVIKLLSRKCMLIYCFIHCADILPFFINCALMLIFTIEFLNCNNFY